MEVTKALFDTNCYNKLAQKDNKLHDFFRKLHTIYISPIVIGEICAGIEGGSNVKNNKRVLDSFIRGDTMTILEVTDKTAKIYGKLFFLLRKNGKPIPTNDIWIATQCIEHDVTLITSDRHFQTIPKLKLKLISSK